MSRTTDEQVAEWTEWAADLHHGMGDSTGHEMLDALESERSRADQLQHDLNICHTDAVVNARTAGCLLWSGNTRTPQPPLRESRQS